MTDPLFRMLANLPEAEPDRARAARVRTRCHAALARHRPSRSPRPNGALRFSEALLAGLGSVYLAETIRQVLRLYGMV
jgi:hypothetical protein